jgi:hypothetical protein
MTKQGVDAPAGLEQIRLGELRNVLGGLEEGDFQDSLANLESVKKSLGEFGSHWAGRMDA